MGFLLLSRRYITIKDSYVSIVTIVILSINFSIIFFPQLIYFFIITISMIITINSLLCLSCFIFDIYSLAATFFFNLVFFSLLCSFVWRFQVVSNYCKYRHFLKNSFKGVKNRFICFLIIFCSNLSSKKLSKSGIYWNLILNLCDNPLCSKF